MDEYETKLVQPLTDFGRTVEELLFQIDYFQDLRRGCKTPEESLSREENVREMIRAHFGLSSKIRQTDCQVFLLKRLWIRNVKKNLIKARTE